MASNCQNLLNVFLFQGKKIYEKKALINIKNNISQTIEIGEFSLDISIPFDRIPLSSREYTFERKNSTILKQTAYL